MDKLNVDEEIERMTEEQAPPYRFDSPITALLKLYADVFRGIQRERKANEQRGAAPMVAAQRVHEQRISDFLAALLQRHPLWPFLESQNGMKTALAGRFIGEIGHPHKYPGQPCADGHHIAPGSAPDGTCPVVVWKEVKSEDRKKEPCGAALLPPRQKGTGVRSLWHQMGCHTVDGHAPTLALLKREDGGYDTRDWNARLKTLAMMPQVGLAEQIVKHKPEPYFQKYTETMVRKAAERGITGDLTITGNKDLMRARHIARVVAVKAWAGDLLVAWKEAVPLNGAK